MKFIWETGDIALNMGTIVEKPGSGEWWMLGWTDGEVSGGRYTMISMRDGMVTSFHLAGDLAKKLNDSGMRPIVDRVQINAAGTRQPARLGDAR